MLHAEVYCRASDVSDSLPAATGFRYAAAASETIRAEIGQSSLLRRRREFDAVGVTVPMREWGDHGGDHVVLSWPVVSDVSATLEGEPVDVLQAEPGSRVLRLRMPRGRGPYGVRLYRISGVFGWGRLEDWRSGDPSFRFIPSTQNTPGLIVPSGTTHGFAVGDAAAMVSIGSGAVITNEFLYGPMEPLKATGNPVFRLPDHYIYPDLPRGNVFDLRRIEIPDDLQATCAAMAKRWLALELAPGQSAVEPGGGGPPALTYQLRRSLTRFRRGYIR